MKLEIHPSFLALLKRQAAQNGVSIEEFVEALLDEHLANNASSSILGCSFSESSRSSACEVEDGCKDSDQEILSYLNEWLGKNAKFSPIASTNYLEWQPPAYAGRSVKVVKKKTAKAEFSSNTGGGTAYNEW